MQKRQRQKKRRILGKKVDESRIRKILKLADSLITRENERKRLVKTREYDSFAQNLYKESLREFLKALKNTGLSKNLSLKEKEKILEEAKRWIRKKYRY